MLLEIITQSLGHVALSRYMRKILIIHYLLLHLLKMYTRTYGSKKDTPVQVSYLDTSFKKVFLKMSHKKIHIKTTVPESLLQLSFRPWPATLLKKDSDTGVFL